MIPRRRFLQWGCATCALLYSRLGWSQTDIDYAPPFPFVRPEPSSDEGGLWAMMDREEKNLRRNPLLIRDEKFQTYVRDIAQRLAGEHTSNMRVYLVRTPHFNANMAPNGAMQVWTGLLLRATNEAQLAAVIGHEIGHYLEKHSLARLRDIKDKAAVNQVIGLFGLAGLAGTMAVQASALAYQRDHEREADRIGSILMHRAGYKVDEAARIWDDLLQEKAAQEDKSLFSPMFATHPPSAERRDALSSMATSLPGGVDAAQTYQAQISPFLLEWCEDELKRGQPAESITLFTRLMQTETSASLFRCFRAESYRLRSNSNDHDLAFADYLAVTQSQQPNARAYRGIGLIERLRHRPQEAAAAFAKYVELAPEAPDAGLIQSYLSELRS